MNSQSMPDFKVAKLVEDWFAGECTMFDACTEDPEIAWQAILDICRYKLNDEQVALLGSGPIETLIVWHGKDFIDQIVKEAARGGIFKKALKMVWSRRISAELWNQILEAIK